MSTAVRRNPECECPSPPAQNPRCAADRLRSATPIAARAVEVPASPHVLTPSSSPAARVSPATGPAQLPSESDPRPEGDVRAPSYPWPNGSPPAGHVPGTLPAERMAPTPTGTGKPVDDTGRKERGSRAAGKERCDNTVGSDPPVCPASMRRGRCSVMPSIAIQSRFNLDSNRGRDGPSSSLRTLRTPRKCRGGPPPAADPPTPAASGAGRGEERQDDRSASPPGRRASATVPARG